MWFSGLKRTGKWVESSASTILKLDALLTLMRIYKMEEGRENFMDRYFSDGYEYLPPYKTTEPFKNGTYYNYVSNTLLNGVINYVKLIKVYLMDRYTEDLLKRYSAIRRFNTGPEFHTNLGAFGDDIILLAYEEESGFYWFFWFDCDCSDCSIGRFTTEDSKEEVIESFTQWVLERQKNFCNYYHKEREGMAVELNCENIKGWVSF